MAALDATRKQVQRDRSQTQRRRIFKRRKLLRKAHEDLDEEGRRALSAILRQEPVLDTAYQLKEAFRQWYQLTIPEQVIQAFPEWYRQVEASQLPE